MSLSEPAGESFDQVGEPSPGGLSQRGGGWYPDRFFGILFLSAFSLQISFLFGSILLNVLKRPLPPVLGAVLPLLGFLFFAVLLFVYIRKTSVSTKEATLKGMAGTVLSSAAGILFMYAIILGFAQIRIRLLAFLPMLLEEGEKPLLFFAAVAAVAVVLLILLMTAVVLVAAIFDHCLPVYRLGKAYGILLAGMLKKAHWLILYSLGAGVLLYLMNLLLGFLSAGLELFVQKGFYFNFLLYSLGALPVAFFLRLLLQMARRLIYGMEDRLAALSGPPGLRVPIFALIILIFTIVLSVLSAPLYVNSADGILAEVNLHKQKADALSSLGLARKSVHEYEQAYSKLLSLQAYLEGLKYYKTNQVELINHSADLMREAQAASLANPYVPFFRGRLYLMDKNYSSAVDSFETALLCKGGMEEAWFGLLDAYGGLGQPEGMREALQVLTSAEIYYDRFSDLPGWDAVNLDRYLSKIEELDKILGPKMVYKAAERAKMLDGTGAADDLLALQRKYPHDPLVNYYAAKIINETRNEQVHYANVRQFAENFDVQYELQEGTDDGSELSRKLFTAQMYLGANDLAAAEALLKETLDKYPESEAAAKQYAYVLYKSNKPDLALKVLEEWLPKDPKNLEILHLSALCHIAMQQAGQALEKMTILVETAEKDENLTPDLDRYLYTFSLKFSGIFTGEAVMVEVEKLKDRTVLYNYLYAIQGWKQHDAPKSTQYIIKVTEKNPELGYAWYIMGVNAYEDTVRNGRTDFSEAEKLYLRSIRILPRHAEGYFALAHCYKKWGKNLEALRAFRKVVDLMPYEDHRMDPYGITVHAIGEISSLSKYDIKEGN